MTNWFVLHYSVFDQEVSFKDYGTIEKEKKLPCSRERVFNIRTAGATPNDMASANVSKTKPNSRRRSVLRKIRSKPRN